MSGTPPDGYSSRPMTDFGDENRELFHEMTAEWAGSMKWGRFTVDEDHRTLWLEVWKRRPEVEAPFNPPYTAEPTSVRHEP